MWGHVYDMITACRVPVPITEKEVDDVYLIAKWGQSLSQRTAKRAHVSEKLIFRLSTTWRRRNFVILPTYNNNGYKI